MKYVIHHHSTYPEHYDLMIEKDEMLDTWQISSEDIINLINEIEIEAVKIKDHRKKYLSYEGPISCDRGRVSLYDTGDYSSIIWDDNFIELNMKGEKLSGDIMIIKKTKDIYKLKYKKLVESE